MADMVKMIDEEYRLYINEKPKYFPAFIWRWMVRKIVKVTIKK